MAGVDVYTGSAWVVPKDVQVYTGTAWKQAKKMKAYSGSAWILTWVPKVPSVVITFSKTGVVTGEKFDVTVTYAAGYPEGTKVRVTTNTGYDTTFSPAEGATSVLVDDISHGGVGSPVWSAVATNLGGVSATATKTQTVTAPAPTHYHKVVPAGASAATIQAEMNNAKTWWLANKNLASVNFDNEQDFACVELTAGASYPLNGSELHPRRGVRLVGGGSGTSRPWVDGVSPSTHVVNTDSNGGGAYNCPDYDWLITNIRFNCTTYSGGFSIAHTKRFRVSECYFTNMGGKKHYIEINSSGGARADGTYNCQVINCEFTAPNPNVTSPSERRCEDECVQLDYSWAGAASAVANDGTVTNNVLIQGCNFHDAVRAIGGHHHGDPGDSSRHPPNGNHGNILIQNNTLTNIDPDQYGGSDAPNGSGSEGAIRCYVWNNVQILNNTFNDCYQPINLYINSESPSATGEPTRTRIAGNVFNSKTSSRACINSSSANSGKRFQQILAESNTFNGTWNGSDYFIGFGDTGCSDYPGLSNPVVIRNNRFQPSDMTASEEKGYNKYKADGADNCGSDTGGVLLSNNTVSDGTVDNS